MNAYLLARVFVDRIVWWMVADGRLVGTGLADDYLALRNIQVRAGLLKVTIECPAALPLPPYLELGQGEWTAATEADRAEMVQRAEGAHAKFR